MRARYAQQIRRGIHYARHMWPLISESTPFSWDNPQAYLDFGKCNPTPLARYAYEKYGFKRGWLRDEN